MLYAQTGRSALATAILLAAMAYGIFIAIQYLPHKLESVSVNSVLESLASKQQTHPAPDVHSVEAALNRLLSINQLDELREDFQVQQSGDDFIVEVSYQRTINLLFDEKTLYYDQAITLESGKKP